MELNLNYTHAENMGYGRLGVKLAEALKAEGVTVYDHMPKPADAKVNEFYPEEPDRNFGTAATTCWVAIPTHSTGWWDTQHVALFSMWEATRLPEQFREALHHYDTVIVPSWQNVELFGRYHDNVRLALLGVDPTEWNYRERTQPGAFFDFLCGGSGARKGTDLTVAAFKAAFPTASPDGPIPRLTMKNPRGEDFQFDGRITTISGKLSAEDEQDLYASAHCYVQPSRGEGFGLQPLQALAQGCPTILTDAHGHESFAHLGHGISATLTPAAYFMYGDAGEWWEPSLDELIDTMRWVYDNYDEAAAKAKVSAEVVAEDFTWANTARSFMDALPTIGDRMIPSGHAIEPRQRLRILDRWFPRLSAVPEYGNWVTPSPLKYRIRTVKDWPCDIAGRRMIFRKGVDYWELADVKRILAESGLNGGTPILDDDCLLGDDAGLADEQVARLRLPTGTSDPDLTKWHAGV